MMNGFQASTLPSVQCSLIDSSCTLIESYCSPRREVAEPPKSYHDFKPELSSTRMMVDDLPDSKDDFIPILSSTMIVDEEEFHLVCMHLGL
jgi:hypothetical protein